MQSVHAWAFRLSRGIVDTLLGVDRTPARSGERARTLVCLAITGVGAGDSRGHGGFFYDRIILPLVLKRLRKPVNDNGTLMGIN